MPKSKLGPYILSLGATDMLDYFTRAQPRVAVSIDHDPNTWRAIKQATPNTFVVGRFYLDDSEQIFLDDPESRAEAFFNMMKPDAERMRGIYDAWMSYNEPILHSRDEAQRLSRFHARWGDLMRAAGLVSCAYSFSAGNPSEGDPRPDGTFEPNYWLDLAEGLRHCDLLSLHEYDAPTLSRVQGYLCLRYRKAIAALPPDAQRQVVITECGIDGGTLDSAHAQFGWQKFTNEDGYLATLQWYDTELQKDNYVIGAAIFALAGWPDSGPGKGSFSIVGANKLRDYMGQGGAPTPVVIHPQLPQTLQQAVQARADSAKPWMPVNNTAALWRYAKAHGLQDQQTDELSFNYNGENYIAQVFNLGIVYCKVGDYANIKVIPK
jgi:hypothetical protein